MKSSRLPDFIIGGAPRAGTTWLRETLDRHPRIYMARPARPEPKFFLVDEIFEQGMKSYSAWFAGVRPDQLAGEKSTNYLESRIAAGRIRRHLPSVKLIFILRDPVERAYSNYLWSRMNGLEPESFLVALSLEDEREREIAAALKYARPHAYFSRGLYAELLAPWFELFPRAQILCLKHEEIETDAPALMRTVCSFLDVDPAQVAADGANIVNPSRKDAEGIPTEARDRLIAAYAEPNRRLARLLGPQFRIWEY